MAETSPLPANLQPSANNPLETGDPQQFTPGSLQPQASANLQPSSSQTVNAINALDQGSASINLSSITNTTATTVSVPTATARFTNQFLVYSLVAIIGSCILGYIVYNLLRPHS